MMKTIKTLCVCVFVYSVVIVLKNFNQTDKQDKATLSLKSNRTGQIKVPAIHRLRNYRLPKLDRRQKAELVRRVRGEILEWSQVRDKRDPLLNDHRFVYSINTSMCRDHTPDVLVFVQTAVSHLTHRSNIRHTWGNWSQIGNITLRTIFFLGQTRNTSLQQVVQTEAEIHMDIVQGNFMDTYTNLTYKHVMALGWIIKECPDVKLIVKVDDDIILNVFNLVQYVQTFGFPKGLLRCSIYFHQHPIRAPNQKWYVNWATYPMELYPSYCEGFGYLMSPDVAKTLNAASENARFYWVDDVYVTGILTLKVGLNLKSFHGNHTNVRSIWKRSNFDKYLFIFSDGKWHGRWNEVLRVSHG